MELIRDELCEQIVSAAERLAQGKDPGKLTVRDILKEMGITNRVFYNHRWRSHPSDFGPSPGRHCWHCPLQE